MKQYRPHFIKVPAHKCVKIFPLPNIKRKMICRFTCRHGIPLNMQNRFYNRFFDIIRIVISINITAARLCPDSMNTVGAGIYKFNLFLSAV